MYSRVLVWVLAVSVCGAASVSAQTPSTRADALAQEQAEKARASQPYTRNWAERKFLEIEQAGGFAVARGLFVTFGDIKPGSSIALGPAYAKTFGNGAVVIAKAAYSIRNFKMAQLWAQAPLSPRGRLIVDGRVRWQDAPKVAVYALGQNSPNVRSDYSETKTEVSGQATLRPVSFLRFGAGAGFERFETGPNLDPLAQAPLILTSTPGVGADPEYVHSFLSAAIDSRAGPGYSRRGTLLQATAHDYSERNDGRYSFRRVDGIAQQMIPILHGNWVLDFALRGSTTSADAGNTVPFFLMPELGGGTDLRGYANYRFRDRHSLLFTAEYRWYVQEFVDMAIFYDAGKVTARRSGLDFDGLKSDVGVGVRFHGPRTTVLRFELARGTEGLRFIMGFGPSIR